MYVPVDFYLEGRVVHSMWAKNQDKPSDIIESAIALFGGLELAQPFDSVATYIGEFKYVWDVRKQEISVSRS